MITPTHKEGIFQHYDMLVNGCTVRLVHNTQTNEVLSHRNDIAKAYGYVSMDDFILNEQGVFELLMDIQQQTEILCNQN